MLTPTHSYLRVGVSVFNSEDVTIRMLLSCIMIVSRKFITMRVNSIMREVKLWPMIWLLH